MRCTSQLAFCIFGLVAALALAREPAKPKVVFEPNQGQFMKGIAFLGRAPGFTVKLLPEEGGLVFQAPDAPPALLRLRGARVSARASGEARALLQTSYFHGNDPSRWRTHVPTFGRIRWAGVYPGVDLLLRGTDRGVEIDFEVAPGASAAPIAWSAGPGAELRSRRDGTLRLEAGRASFTLQAPHSWELGPEDARSPLLSRYQRLGGAVGFAVADRHPDRALLIDPEVTTSAWISDQSNHDVQDTCFTAAGDRVYVGNTSSTGDFVTDGSSLKGSGDIQVTVNRLSDNVALFASYIGGSGQDQGQAVTLAPDGKLVVGGFTSSPDFPTLSPVQGSLAGGADGILLRLGADGTLASSTYWGGTGDELLTGIATDSAGSLYATGTTSSTDFPFRNIAPVASGGGNDAFVLKLSTGAAAVTYSQTMGGNDFDWAFHVAAAPDGSAVVVGETKSTNFPVTAARQTTNAGDFDGFVARLTTAGAVLYSTYLGSSGTDITYQVSLAADGSAWVSGYTTGSDFPVIGPFRPFSGVQNGYFAHLDGTGALLRSAFTGPGRSQAIATDPNGGVFVVGETSDSAFPVLDALQPTYAGGAHDEFILHLAQDTEALDFSTFLGGDGDDQEVIAHAYANGAVVVLTKGNSTNFNTEASGAVPSPGNSYNFVTELNVAPTPQAVAPAAGPSLGGTPVTLIGQDFRAGDSVLFDGVAGSAVHYTDAHTLTVNTPAHAPGTVNVAVKRGSLQPVLSAGFTYSGSAAQPDAGTGQDAGVRPDGGAPGEAGAGPSPGRYQVTWACQATPGASFWLPLALTVISIRTRSALRTGKSLDYLETKDR